MKLINKVLSCLLILGLVLFLIKPESASISNHQTKYSSATSPCSSRVLVSFCSGSMDYTLNEAQYGLNGFVFLFIGLMHFLLVQRKYFFSISNIFKPPILD